MIVPNGNGLYLHPVDNQLSGRVRATRARTGYGDPIVKILFLAPPLFLISEFQVQGMSRETPESKLFNRPESSSSPQKVLVVFHDPCLVHDVPSPPSCQVSTSTDLRISFP